jgi:hypothetical protein
MGDDKGQFHLAEVVIRDQKYFDVSLEEILRQHSWHRKFEVSSTVQVLDENINEAVDVYLVLKVSGRAEFRMSWDVALMLHNVRIDGFGFEESWIGRDGNECNGWHRHIWNFRKLHAKDKEPVTCFDPADIFQHFVTTAFREMNILLSGRDDGPTSMF